MDAQSIHFSLRRIETAALQGDHQRAAELKAAFERHLGSQVLSRKQHAKYFRVVLLAEQAAMLPDDRMPAFAEILEGVSP